MQDNLLNRIFSQLNNQQNIILTGLSGSAKSYLINELLQGSSGKTLCLVASEEKAYDLARDLEGFLDPDHIHLFLGRDLIFVKENYALAEIRRILALQECLLHPRRKSLIITTPAALMYPLISPGEMKKLSLKLEVGQEEPLENILKRLVESGYRRVDTVTGPGEFALRGGILDIYPLGDRPLRMEFFGDFIESIRRFNTDTQRSGKKEQTVHIGPADELLGDDLNSTLFDYLGRETSVFLDEPRDFYRAFDKNIKRYHQSVKEAQKEEKNLRELPVLSHQFLTEKIQARPVIYHSFFSGNIPQVKVGMIEHISQKEMEPFYNDYEAFFTRVKGWLDKGYQVRLAVKSRAAREQLKKDTIDHHLVGIEFSNQQVEKGFISQSLNLALISEGDIWGKRPARGAKTKKRQQERLLIEDLKLGDYVVHENYGVGIFRGVTQVEVDKVTREYILLQYAGTDKLYLPVDKLDLLYKYTSSEDKEPRLSKLGGTEWERTKKRVAKSIQEMAEQLLKLYATRQALEGYAFSPDTPWQRQFEDTFPFQETPDQLKAINDVKRDMESRRPMDRLICGDVGYGKTEVAMRAAFKAIMDGKQAAILVPTTVLAEQHYQTFKERFADFPAVIEVISRFKTPAQQKTIIADLKKGVVDLVIGTHRLLSRDVGFKDLGLLVVDEEHRFGVRQKEKIKAFKELVDVLSLSATPIPRSLHMSLTGLRDLSVIETPPPQRYPITTYVMEYNQEVVAEAILMELEREGQVFFVHNRIEDIYQVKEKLEQLLPGVKIAVGHGRMKEQELAPTMMSFLKGEYQVFLCTTIIESGLDMPNVNTMIVDEADKMGLAQLYQLRGRVGRSHRVAHAYLTYRPERVLTETAQKRLNAIREFNELGSGMKIALRDLEIRGAGNILGPEQHGYIHAVGFDLYCRLLEEETSRLRGVPLKEQIDTQVDVDVDYYIPDSYIPDSGSKMRIYRQLLLAQEGSEIEELKNEILDRFGPLPPPVENFLQIAALRLMARNKAIKSLRRKGRRIEIEVAGKLPNNLEEQAKGLRIKRISDKTLQIQTNTVPALSELQNLLTLI